jgi:hypothetical protein
MRATTALGAQLKDAASHAFFEAFAVGCLVAAGVERVAVAALLADAARNKGTERGGDFEHRSSSSATADVYLVRSTGCTSERSATMPDATKVTFVTSVSDDTTTPLQP